MKQDDVREDWEKELVRCFSQKGGPQDMNAYVETGTKIKYIATFIRSLLASHFTSLLQKMEQVIGEDESVSNIRITGEAAETLGSITTAAEGRNKLRAEQRKALSDCIAIVKDYEK